MVADGVDFDEGGIKVFEEAGEIGVELVAFLVAEEGAAVFGAEDEVNDEVGEGLGHWVSPLQGFYWLGYLHPALLAGL